MNNQFIGTALGCMSIVAVTACGGADVDENGIPLDPSAEGIALEASPAGSTPEMNPALDASTGDETTKACAQRPDLVSFITLREGTWGDWAPCFSFCANNAFTYEAQLKSEANQGGGGDDTAANGIGLHCFDRTTGADKGWITSRTQQWGGWGTIAQTGNFVTGNPWIGGQAWVERAQGSGDDTAFNKLGLYDKFGGQAGGGIFPGFAVDFSTNVFSKSCAAGTAICGIRTQVEATQVGDDTALNGLQFACCTF
jgi:hypothetical protein